LLEYRVRACLQLFSVRFYRAVTEQWFCKNQLLPTGRVFKETKRKIEVLQELWQAAFG
jgi:hypothetical protein